MITVEIIRMQEKKNPPTCLITDAGCLFRGGSLRQQEFATTLSPGLHHHPAFLR
jgi:hypothetical protein